MPGGASAGHCLTPSRKAGEQDLKSVRGLAAEALAAIEDNQNQLRGAVDPYLEALDGQARDRRFLTHLVNGCVRLQISLDFALDHFSRRDLHSLPVLTRMLLRVGAYQVLFLESVPHRAAVYETVKAAHEISHRGTANYVNAVLRNLIRGRAEIPWPKQAQDPAHYIHICQSYPRWMAERWVEQLGGPWAAALARALNRPPRAAARINRLAASRRLVESRLQGENLLAASSSIIPECVRAVSHQALLDHPGFDKGWYYIQSEASCLPACAAQLRPGMQVYDLCSAPGGKACHIADCMHDRGNIQAYDISGNRLRRLQENTHRLGISIIDTICLDARAIKAQPRDRVFLDAPCSGFGTLNHRADLRWQKDPSQMQSLVALQRQLLTKAAELTSAGGLLVYSTCTTDPAENEGQVRWFLHRHPGFSLEPLPHWFPQHTTQGMLQVWPHLDSTDGFFVAALRKRREVGTEGGMIS